MYKWYLVNHITCSNIRVGLGVGFGVGLATKIATTTSILHGIIIYQCCKQEIRSNKKQLI